MTVRSNEELLEEVYAEAGRLGGGFGARVGAALSGLFWSRRVQEHAGASGGAAGARLGARLLKMDVREKDVSLRVDAATAERETRTILEAMGEPQPPLSDDLPLRTFVRDGLKNPAVLEARVEHGDGVSVVHLRASAREPLIKHRTAQKTLDEAERRLLAGPA